MPLHAPQSSRRTVIGTAIKGFSSEYAAKYAVDRMLEGKKIIIPGIKIKATRILAKIIPDKIMAFFCYKMQKRKI